MSLFNTATGKSAKFATIGDQITGTIKQAPYERQQTKFGSSEPEFWPNGDPKIAIVVPLQTALREDTEDDGERTLWVSSTSMKKAIGQAIANAKVQDVTVGGVLTVQYIGNDPESKNPANPKKLYTATYTPGTTSLAPVAAPQPVPQAAPAVTPDQASKIAQLRNAGIDDQTIATATGVTPETLATIPF